MADFLAVLSSPAAASIADSRFETGLALAHELQGQQAISITKGAGFCAAGFPRRDGSGGRVAIDRATGCWALAAGTWFHRHRFGAASGAESWLLTRWLDAGIDTLARELDGSFVIVLCDPRTGDAFAITDAVGTHFAFLREEPGICVIGSSSLVLAGLGPEDPDRVGVQEIMRTGCAYEGRTAHRDVRRLFGGSIHRFRAGVLVRSSNHWTAADAPRDRLEGADAADALHAALGDAARRIHALEPRILSDLTGGYDSRALLSGFLGAGIAPATTVSGSPDSGDVTIAARIAELAGLQHCWTPSRPATSLADVERVMPFTDGEYDAVEYAPILSAQAASVPEHGISVAGSAGEITRGRFWMHLMPHIGRRGPMDARRLVATRFRDSRSDPSLFPAASRLDLQEHYLGVIGRETAELTPFPNTLQCDALFLTLRMSAWQGRIASSTDRLRRCVAPFLCRSVLDVSLSMSVRTRYRSRVIREMLARHSPGLARIPMTRGYPPLPFTPRTVFAFRTLPAYYAKRIAAKAARTAGFGVALEPTAGAPVSSRLALWEDEAVRAQLDPRSMHMARLLSAERLEKFLAASREPAFAFEGAWNRLLTLETTMRRLSAARQAVRTRIRDSSVLGRGVGQ